MRRYYKSARSPCYSPSYSDSGSESSNGSLACWKYESQQSDDESCCSSIDMPIERTNKETTYYQSQQQNKKKKTDVEVNADDGSTSSSSSSNRSNSYASYASDGDNDGSSLVSMMHPTNCEQILQVIIYADAVKCDCDGCRYQRKSDEEKLDNTTQHLDVNPAHNPYKVSYLNKLLVLDVADEDLYMKELRRILPGGWPIVVNSTNNDEMRNKLVFNYRLRVGPRYNATHLRSMLINNELNILVMSFDNCLEFFSNLQMMIDSTDLEMTLLFSGMLPPL